MIDRFLNWGDHGKPKSGKIKGRCQRPLVVDIVLFFGATPMPEETRKLGITEAYINNPKIQSKMLGNEREIWILEILKPFQTHEQKNIYKKLITTKRSPTRYVNAQKYAVPSAFIILRNVTTRNT